MKRTWVKNAKIVNEGKTFEGSIVISGDIIEEVLVADSQPEKTCDETIDAQGCYLIPGVIDDHVHFRDPGLTHKADMHSESKAAIAGGVTSFMDMPNTVPQTTTIEALNDKFTDASQKSLANYSFYFGATNNNTHLISQLDKQQVCGIKLFMGASTGNMLVDRMETLKDLFEHAGMLIAVHCEDQSIINANIASFKGENDEDLDIKYHPLIRDERACYESSALAVQLAKETGARLHILHISTAKELELLENKPLTEKTITAEACVSHLFFCDKDYEQLGARIKCNPSIKTQNDRDALRKAIQSNLVDVIGTDHAPHLLSEKQGGALKAVSGMPTIQFSLVTMMELMHKKVLTMEQVVDKMCHAPAQLYQIENRGFIRKGYKADIVIVNPNSPWTVNNECIISKCGWSPMLGQTYQSKVEKTFVNGHLVYQEGMIDDTYRGEALKFKRS
jgi:dihydroorotase